MQCLWKNNDPPQPPLSGYYNACAYPYLSKDMFRHAVQVSLSTGFVTILDQIIIDASPFSKVLPGSQTPLPAYTIRLHHDDADPLHDRMALIGIGSNCAPSILFEKLRKAHVGGSFITCPALLINHAVVYGAFIGASGTIPATVMPDRATTSQVTVSLVTAEQAEALTATEKNYDLTLIEDNLSLNISESQPLCGGALMYASIWGALRSEPGDPKPISLAAIRSVTPNPQHTSEQVVHRVAAELGHQADTEAFFNTLPTLSLAERLSLIHILQKDAIPARIHGRQVKPASIAKDAGELGFMVPAIQYL